jgi:hypothetical protein
MAGIARKLVNKLKIGNTTVKTSAGDVTMANEGIVVVNKASGAATAVTLTPSPDQGDFVFVVDGKGDAATNNITISGAAAETINGGASYVISENYGGVCFVYNDTEWNVVSTYKSDTTLTSATITDLTATTAAITTATITTSNSTTDNVAGITTWTNVATVAATGTVITNAAAITAAVTLVTGADTAKGVILPVTATGRHVMLYSNVAASGLKVYPQVNSNINDGTTNAEIVMEGKSFAHFVGINATTWAAIYTANA